MMKEILQRPIYDEGGDLFKSDFLWLSRHIAMMKNTVFKFETDTFSRRSDDYKTFKEAILDTGYKEEWVLGMSILSGYFLAASPTLVRLWCLV